MISLSLADLFNLFNMLRSRIKTIIDSITVYNKPKVFGIGANKTGTTSLKKAMADLGYLVGSQGKAENFIYDWGQRDFHRIIRYCYSAQFFQDIPFSLPFTYVVMDHEFPGSKFILTVRNDSEEWYNSLINYHSLKFGLGFGIPDVEKLKSASYNSQGWAWDALKIACDITNEDPYNKDRLTEYYEAHNRMVKKYFRHRPQDLLILNPSDPLAMKKLCNFLGEKEVSNNSFPKENVTKT